MDGKKEFPKYLCLTLNKMILLWFLHGSNCGVGGVDMGQKKGLSKNFDAGGAGYVHKFGIGRKVDVGQKNNVIFVPFFSITL